MSTSCISTVWMLIILFSCISVRAQERFPVIGEPCPEIVLDNVLYYNDSKVTVSNLKGKWTLLYFFSAGCSACFQSFPKLNEFRKDFRDRMEVILIGNEGGNIRASYEKFRLRQKLALPIAYDSSLFRRFEIYGVPNIMMIDPHGVVRAITSSITRSNIEDFLADRDPQLIPKLNRLQLLDVQYYEPDRPLLIYNNGGPDSLFLFRSVLTRWKGDIVAVQQVKISVQKEDNRNRVQVVGVGLRYLYNLAYGDTISMLPDKITSYGSLWPQPVLELHDSSAFVYDANSTRNRYNYSLIVPDENVSAKRLKEIMQRDLINYFGYDVKVETRMMPYWRVVLRKDTPGQYKSFRRKENEIQFPDRTGFQIRDKPVNILIFNLFSNFQYEPPFIDETGITENINVTVDALLTDLEQVRIALNKYGLDLVRSRRPMKVIVIRQPEYRGQ